MCLEANDYPIKFFNENETGARIGGVGVRTGNALATVALDTPRGDGCIVEIHVHRVLPIVTYGCGRGYDCGGGHGCEAFQRRGRDCDVCALQHRDCDVRYEPDRSENGCGISSFRFHSFKNSPR